VGTARGVASACVAVLLFYLFAVGLLFARVATLLLSFAAVFCAAGMAFGQFSEWTTFAVFLLSLACLL
jgi:hypothetical protein